jgi:integrase
VEEGTWTPPARRIEDELEAARRENEKRLTLREYGIKALKARKIKPRTLVGYLGMLERLILPTLGDCPLVEITPEMVRAWHDKVGISAEPKRAGKAVPRQQAHVYTTLRLIFNQAIADGLVRDNPCHIEGAGGTSPKRDIEVPTAQQVDAMACEMPARLALAVLLGAWCGLRKGEVLALRRGDVDTETWVLHVRRGVVRVDGRFIDDMGPKTTNSVRDLPIPPRIRAAVSGHLAPEAGYMQRGKDALLFPSESGGYMHESTIQKYWSRARAKVERPDLHFHDLRGTGATWLGQQGATLAELMAWLGDKTVIAAMRYQHSSMDRLVTLTNQMSAAAAEPALTLRSAS